MRSSLQSPAFPSLPPSPPWFCAFGILSSKHLLDTVYLMAGVVEPSAAAAIWDGCFWLFYVLELLASAFVFFSFKKSLKSGVLAVTFGNVFTAYRDFLTCFISS